MPLTVMQMEKLVRDCWCDVIPANAGISSCKEDSRFRGNDVQKFYTFAVMHQIGLTLIEVLIALAIVAIAMTAIIKATAQNIRSTEYLQNKTMASWVGQAVLNEARLGIIKFSTADNSLQNKTEMLGRTWYWQVSQQETPNLHIKKIMVDVFKQEPQSDETPLNHLESYVYAAN